jgi:hypothetical protein
MMTGSLFWTVVIAGSGGLLVLIGLFMETLPEIKEYKSLVWYRRSKCIKHWGEWLVIAGVFIEVVLSGFTAIDEWQIKQTAIKNDPFNQPLKSLNAVATLYFIPKVMVSNEWRNSIIPTGGWHSLTMTLSFILQPFYKSPRFAFIRALIGRHRGAFAARFIHSARFKIKAIIITVPQLPHSARQPGNTLRR